MNLAIYTDGAVTYSRSGDVHAKSGVGGYSCIFAKGDKVVGILHRGVRLTTHNRMELMAAVRALHQVLKVYTEPKCNKVTIHSDSKYVIDGVNEWLAGWKQRGWKTAGKKPVMNVDLWQMLDKLKKKVEKRMYVEFVWVKAHAGNKFNELADLHAVVAKEGPEYLIDEEFEKLEK